MHTCKGPLTELNQCVIYIISQSELDLLIISTGQTDEYNHEG